MRIGVQMYNYKFDLQMGQNEFFYHKPKFSFRFYEIG